ncbi:MAG: histidine kinase dimerization/phospho-acceptor domain-containing protein [bacterium]
MGLAGLGLAHELNGPLTATGLALELLAERLAGDAPPSVAEIAAEVGRIQANVQRMTALVRHLRAFARGDRSGWGRWPSTPWWTPPLRLAGPAAEALGNATLSRGAAAPPPSSRATLLLEQAVLCVLLNAVEAGARRARHRRSGRHLGARRRPRLSGPRPDRGAIHQGDGHGHRPLPRAGHHRGRGGAAGAG